MLVVLRVKISRLHGRFLFYKPYHISFNNTFAALPTFFKEPKLTSYYEAPVASHTCTFLSLLNMYQFGQISPILLQVQLLKHVLGKYSYYKKQQQCNKQKKVTK